MQGAGRKGRQGHQPTGVVSLVSQCGLWALPQPGPAHSAQPPWENQGPSNLRCTQRKEGGGQGVKGGHGGGGGDASPGMKSHRDHRDLLTHPGPSPPCRSAHTQSPWIRGPKHHLPQRCPVPQPYA